MAKNRWTLAPWAALDDVISVLTTGAGKHGDEGWKTADGKKYLDAAMRHISEHLQGVTADHESGKPPLAHAVADLLIAMALRPTETVKPADILPHDVYGPITKLPDWAEWVAVDADGGVWVYEKEPDDRRSRSEWTSHWGDFLHVNRTDPPSDWRQTKRRIKK